MKHLFLILSIIFTLNSWAQISTSGSIPVGAVIQFDLTACPSGWLPRDGSCVSKTTYAKLYQAIGSRYESTFGTCTTGFFRLADARGLFARNAGSNATLMMANGTKYTGGSVGAKQADAFQGHEHLERNGGGVSAGYFTSGGGTGPSVTGYGIPSPNSLTANTLVTGGAYTDGTNGTPRTSNETRPVNVAKYVFIRYEI